MARKQLNLEDVMNLPYAQLKGVVEHYSQKQSGDFSNTLNQLVESNFEQHFEKLEINTTCPSYPSDEVIKMENVITFNSSNTRIVICALQTLFYGKHVGIGIFGLKC